MRAKDRLPVKVAWLYLADGRMSSIGATGSGANAESALSKIQAVAHCPANAVKRNPPEQRRVHAALQDAVLHKAAHLVVGQSRSNHGSQAKTAPQPACHVILAAALPHLKLTSGVGASFAGIEAKHHLAEAQAIPLPRGFGNLRLSP